MRGEVVPLDGIVLERSEFDFSLITGESVGGLDGAGSLCWSGANSFEEACCVFHRSKQIFLSVWWETLAFNTVPSTQGDRISRYFVPVVISLALASCYQWIIGHPQEGFLLNECLNRLMSMCVWFAEPLVLTAAIES